MKTMQRNLASHVFMKLVWSEGKHGRLNPQNYQQVQRPQEAANSCKVMSFLPSLENDQDLRTNPFEEEGYDMIRVADKYGTIEFNQNLKSSSM